MKACNKCRRILPSSQFWKCRAKKIGLHAQCKECVKAKHLYASEPYQRWRQKNRHKILEYGQQYRMWSKMEAFIHYSGTPPKCACCGELELAFLTIDHINGGGTRERKTTNARGGVSLSIYLRKRGWPPGYRILCYNCNCATAFVKVCPHQRQQQELG